MSTYDNEVIALLRESKSVREFTDEEISDEIREQILLAACAAPTGGNQQPYTIINVTDQRIKDELAVNCDHQPFIATAKMILIFCADTKKWQDAYADSGTPTGNPGPADFTGGIIDACIAAQNAVVAAASYGIGSCYIGDVVENVEKQRELLHLPEGVMPAAMVVFGYPTQKQKDRVKPARCPLSHIVSDNTYPEMDREYRKALFSVKTGKKTYEEWVHLMCERKHNSDFFAEMNRSVREYLKPFLK